MINQLDNETKTQISQCLDLLKETLGKDLLGIYLYGSAIVGGLQKYSDIDLLVVTNRSTMHEEKIHLVTHLLTISGVYMKSVKKPLELTIVVKSEINPWHYPAQFDFQYGDWLREKFEKNNFEPWSTKVMPDLAILITQVLLANKIIFGPSADQLFSKIPYKDFITATIADLDHLMLDLLHDTRNVLLTLARIWSTIETDRIRSKPDAANWVINKLPEECQHAIKRARAICVGEKDEYWDDIKNFIQPCAEYMLIQINNKRSRLDLSNSTSKSIKYAD